MENAVLARVVYLLAEMYPDALAVLEWLVDKFDSVRFGLNQLSIDAHQQSLFLETAKIRLLSEATIRVNLVKSMRFQGYLMTLSKNSPSHEMHMNNL
ncbi:MAG: hypothetical protein F6K11_19520 [Leptolyngbya sp. SIO3F4]|nr:hypothetical protein [Leptolyngbya sp. SIO3F4]